MDIWYTTVKCILRAYLTVFSRGVHVRGLTLCPPGPKIIAANHPNATDGFYFPFIFREKLYILIQGNLLSLPVFGQLLSKSGQIPVHPKLGKNAIEQACEVLAKGGVVVIFPEGRLNPENNQMQAKAGAVKISLTSGAPIVPVGVYVPEQYTLNIRVHSRGQLRQSRWQYRGRCFIEIGNPWLPALENQEGFKKLSVQELTLRLMNKIYSLAQLASKESLLCESLSYPRVIRP
jgi:1-acyl-sn-glycerol-3-phosphate acyltransferase